MHGQRLLGKKIVVTAATQGIGRATAIAFAKEGAQVLATGRGLSEQKLKELESCKGIKTQILEITDSKCVEDFAAAHSDTDVLFNCAGYVHRGNILECDEAEWDFSFKLNVKSHFLMSKAFIPHMVKKGGGNIINMGSVISMKAVPKRCAYGATKAAVIGLTKSIACDFIKQGIRCNCICPGTTDTPSIQAYINSQPDPEKTRAEFIARQPMGRLGTSEEIANLMVYLASDESTFTTGAVFNIDGGWTN